MGHRLEFGSCDGPRIAILWIRDPGDYAHIWKLSEHSNRKHSGQSTDEICGDDWLATTTKNLNFANTQ